MRAIRHVVAITHFACLIAAAASAQQLPPTLPVTDTSKLAWDAYPDNDNAQKFVAELYAKLDVTRDVNGNIVPRTGAQPLLTLDQGKPAIDALSSSQTGQLLKPALSRDVEYVAFLRVLMQSGDTSALSNATDPFALAIVQTSTCATHFITISVQDWTRSIPVGNRGRVLWQLANSFPIVQLQIKLGQQVVAQIDGTDLRDNAGSYLSLPRTPGAYLFTVFAKDNQGCTAETTTISRSIMVF